LTEILVVIDLLLSLKLQKKTKIMVMEVFGFTVVMVWCYLLLFLRSTEWYASLLLTLFLWCRLISSLRWHTSLTLLSPLLLLLAASNWVRDSWAWIPGFMSNVE